MARRKANTRMVEVMANQWSLAFRVDSDTVEGQSMACRPLARGWLLRRYATKTWYLRKKEEGRNKNATWCTWNNGKVGRVIKIL